MTTEKEGYEDLSETEVPTETITPPEAKVVEDRYVPYHQAEERGVVDRESNAIVGTDVFVILSKILNELDEIKKSQG